MSRTDPRLLAAPLLLAISASAQADPSAPPQPPVVSPAPAAPSAPPGSLWNERSARAMLGMDGNSRQVGDLITVIVAESTSTSLQADTATERKSSIGAKLASLFGIATGVSNANANLEGGIGLGTEYESAFDGGGTTSRESSLEGMLTCKVIEVLPNGNLRIWGWKKVRSNRETQYLVLTGTVRPRDIQLDNTVESYLLAESEIENTGSGVIADKQGPGLGQRVVDRVWPF